MQMFTLSSKHCCITELPAGLQTLALTHRCGEEGNDADVSTSNSQVMCAEKRRDGGMGRMRAGGEK